MGVEGAEEREAGDRRQEKRESKGSEREMVAA